LGVEGIFVLEDVEHREKIRNWSARYWKRGKIFIIIKQKKGRDHWRLKTTACSPKHDLSTHLPRIEID